MADARVDAEVCVVGAGYAGLSAARTLRAAGTSVVVLEARERVGGRVWTEARPGGATVDRGGAWLAPGHDAFRRLVESYGATTHKTWVKGSHLLIADGKQRRYTGLIPKISPIAVATIAVNQLRIDRLARRIALEAPWDSPHAAKWDGRTVAWWLERTGIRSSAGRDLFEMAVRGLFTGDLEDTSFLHLLFLVKAHGSINTLFSIEKGSQENLVVGGAGTVAQQVAEELGDAVRLGTPVRSIQQLDDRVVVRSASTTVEARHVILAIPPALLAALEFDPELPTGRRELYRRAVAGPESKTVVVYDEPFWRNVGLSGQTASPKSVSEVTIDASPPDGPGMLASFTFGLVAERAAAIAPDERRRLVLQELTDRFGSRASSPSDFVETAWWTEEWTLGCSMAHFPPRVLTRYGHLLRTPLGRIHWAGTETSTISHGAIDGAVRSGERAATEVLERA